MTADGAPRGADAWQQVVDAELAEAEFMFAFVSGGPAASRSELGVATDRLHGGVVVAMGNDPSGGYWNKALGFGISEPVTDAVVGDVLDCFRASGSPTAVIQIAPAALPDDWDRVCARHGLEAGDQWVKLLRPPDPAVRATTDFRVEPLPASAALEWADVMLQGFGMPAGPLTRLFAGAVTADPAFHPMVVREGDRMVAAGNLHIKDGRAAFCGVATVPDARNRGAQSALFAARVEVARAAGVRVLSAETWKPPAGTSNPSLNNMIRAGFAPVYDRTNWVWRSDEAVSA